MERQPTIAGFPAGCDLPFLQKYGGMPSLVFGPGNCALAHGSNEHVPIQEVVDAAKVVAIAVLRWCGTQQALARGTPGLAQIIGKNRLPTPP
jgi:acetylornithine deacetylase